MKIEIHISRPYATLCVFAVIVTLFLVLTGELRVEVGSSEAAVTEMDPPLAQAAGGDPVVPQQHVQQAEQGARKAWQERAVLERKEVILRYQLQVLEDKRATLGEGDKAFIDHITQTRNELIQLLRDKHEAERYLLTALRELWDAQIAGGMSVPGASPSQLQWPVNPAYGISAHFLDQAYQKRFGIPHQAIDIPVEQGTPIGAAADGVVERVVDNGFGYSYIILRHGGMATLYGHIEKFLVNEGDQVTTGQSIALSGGLPGTKGAGALTTGPHLHLEVIVDGQRVNPLEYLSEAHPEI